jgi:murein L,D-transpeptidase YcbB/YkuD
VTPIRKREMPARSLARSLPLVVALAAALAGGLPGASAALAAEPQQLAAPSATRIENMLQGDGELRLAGRLLDRGLLAQVYEKRSFEPIWIGAREATLLQSLAQAGTHGLDPSSFAVPDLIVSEREVLLTDAFLRYASALARGRVAPGEFETDWTISVPAFDGPAVLDRALIGDLAAVLAGLAPSDPAYQRLREALSRYRALAELPGWRPLAVVLPLKRGDAGDIVPLLRQRLAAEGFFAEGEGNEFDGPLEAALKRFQAQRGLPLDGQVGPGTLAALNVSAALRVKAIRYNLERWRSLPRDWPATRIEVNVAAATAVLFEGGERSFATRAVVGAVDHPTPVLRARMTSVLFNPPWNVPSSIILKEIRPHLKRDPTYLVRNDYVYVERNGGQQLQQLPGAKNSLGQIKFEMPNGLDIYLHDTPSRTLFQRAKRAFSHGCVRVEDPRGLAQRLLASPDWTLEKIDEAVGAGVTQRAMLRRSLPVYVLYFTAFVDPDGAVQFREDVYGRDKRLAAALAARDAAEHATAMSRADAGTEGGAGCDKG